MTRLLVAQRSLQKAVCICAASIIGFCVQINGRAAEPGVEPCLKSAREAFGKFDYEAVLKLVDQCIDQFRTLADTEESKLRASKAPEPATGDRISDFEKNRIFKRNALNTVGNCLWLKGQAAERRFRQSGKPEFRTEAVQAYQDAAKYSYARAWTERGSFFSPSESALRRLQELK